MINLLIVDDERKAREALRSVVQSYDPSITIHDAEGISSALPIVEEYKPNIILLDIQLSDGTGFELLKKIQPTASRVIFITAFEEYAVRAFRFSAVDYLMKPINPTELKSALDKALSAVEKDSFELRMKTLLGNMNQVSKEQKKIVLKTTEQIFVIGIKDIIHLESDKNYTFFFIADGKKILVSKTLKEYEELLSPYGFIRVHQSHLINVDFIDRYDKREGGFVVMKDQSSIPVSSRKKEDLIGLLGQL
jgi:two-component system LytT family response regulator